MSWISISYTRICGQFNYPCFQSSNQKEIYFNQFCVVTVKLIERKKFFIIRKVNLNLTREKALTNDHWPLTKYTPVSFFSCSFQSNYVGKSANSLFFTYGFAISEGLKWPWNVEWIRGCERLWAFSRTEVFLAGFFFLLSIYCLKTEILRFGNGKESKVVVFPFK